MQKYKINNTYIIKRMINYETEIDIYESRREDKKIPLREPGNKKT